MTGCFSTLFSSRRPQKSKKHSNDSSVISSMNESKSHSMNTGTGRNVNAATACYCSSANTKANAGDYPIDKPPAYTPQASKDIFKPEVLKYIEERVDSYNAELRALSLEIHDHPEIQFEERRTHNTLCAFMESHEFSVTRHYLELETAWRAEFKHGDGGRTIGVNSEMDALPGIGHACGHNLIAICGVGVALAIKDALKNFDIPGKVVLLGTPAEEGGGGKVILIERGGYKDMDACVMSHPGPGNKNSTGLGTSLAIQAIEVEYHGHTAHAAAAPWEGQNALDAAVLAYQAVAVLRQQIKTDHRVHGIIEGKDWAANIIPDYAKMHWIVRAPSAEQVKVLRQRVVNCIKAAAKATECKVDIITPSPPYNDLIQNPVLAQNYGDVCAKSYGMEITDMSGSIGGSTDFGNVSYELPSIHPMFAIPTQPNGGNHTALFTEAAGTKEAHAATLHVIKGLAHTGFRVIDDDDFFRAAQKAFEKHQTSRA